MRPRIKINYPSRYSSSKTGGGERQKYKTFPVRPSVTNIKSFSIHKVPLKSLIQDKSMLLLYRLW